VRAAPDAACSLPADGQKPDAALFQTGVKTMNAIRLTALALIVAGALGLAYGSFSFTRETHEARIGPLSLSVQEKETVNVPLWAGIGAIVAGAALLLLGGKPR
jgi:hypothetical protein